MLSNITHIYPIICTVRQNSSVQWRARPDPNKQEFTEIRHQIKSKLSSYYFYPGFKD